MQGQYAFFAHFISSPCKPASKQASKPASQLASQQASRTASQPANQPASWPASQLASQPARGCLKMRQRRPRRSPRPPQDAPGRFRVPQDASGRKGFYRIYFRLSAPSKRPRHQLRLSGPTQRRFLQALLYQVRGRSESLQKFSTEVFSSKQASKQASQPASKQASTTSQPTNSPANQPTSLQTSKRVNEQTSTPELFI